MEIKHKKINKKIVVIVASIVVLAGASIATALVLKRNNEKKQANQTQNSQQDKQSGNNSNGSSSDNSNGDNGSSENTNSSASNSAPTQSGGDNKTPLQYEGQGTADDPAKSKTISGVINYKQVRDGIAYINATINQPVTGSATLLLTGPNGQSYNTNVDLYNSPSGASMAAFEVPTDKLGLNYSGKWNIKVTVNNSEYNGSITDSIDI